MDNYLPYQKIAEYIGIKKGDIIYLASDVLALSYEALKNGEAFDADLFLESIQRVLTADGTLIIPTFNFEFSSHGSYDYCHTPSAAGALGNAALRRSDFKRTRHPMHSFAVWGRDKEKLCAMANRNSFGDDSPFAYMKEHNVTQVMLGTDYQRSMTFVHYVEYKANVPYRFCKEFRGTYRDESGRAEERTYQYPARRLEVGTVEQFNRIGSILEQRRISGKICVNGITVYKVRLGDSYPVIFHDAAENMCRNLYDFNCDRKRIWEESGNDSGESSHV